MEFWDKKEITDMDRDPANWKMKWFYYNKHDKRLFVPKRNPDLGATVNFANPLSLLVFSPALLLIVLLVILVFLLGN